MKKFISPSTIIHDDQRFFTTISEPLCSEDNETKFTYSIKNNNNNNNNIKKPLKYINKKILKINMEDIKRFKKINMNNKNKNNNKIKNDNKIKNKTISNNKFKKKNSNLDINCFLSDKPKKTNKKINTDIFKTINNYNNNTELENFIGNHKYKLSIKNIKRKLILKRLTKNIKEGKQKQLDYNKIHKKSISNSNNITLKCKSLRKIDNYNDYVESNIKSNIPSVNNKELHKMISEEKKKVLNRFNSLFKNKESKSNKNEYHSKDTYNLNINDKFIKSDQIKNGLYYSTFEVNKFEPNCNNNYN